MDIVTKSLLDEFIKDFNLVSETTEKAFEKFVNYSVVSGEYSLESLEASEVERISVGNNGDIGLDGIAIIVNGKLISSKEEIDDLLEINSYLDVSFIFTQAKTSTSFNSGEVGTFLFGVEDFFSEFIETGISHPYRNDNIIENIDLIKYLYSYSSKMDNQGLPILRLYYVTTGNWSETNKDSISRFENAKSKLSKMKLFKSVSYFPLGLDEIQKLYRSTKGKITAEIVFSNKITLPEINGIKESYFGILSFNEFRKLIIDEQDNLKNVFYDNIRSFQGLNLVNKKIDSTIKSNRQDLFCVLNNGVTLLAKSLTPAGNKFTIREYQIVNGCQTSHVLYHNRNLKDIEKIEIPIKIIISDDDDIKNQIIIATNSQTEVKQEQLIALSDFQKKLENYYDSIKGAGKLYYERRSKQYNSDKAINKQQIVTIPMQIVSFVAMILDEPHNVRGYYGKIVENIEKSGKIIFNENHLCSPYYLSAMSYLRMESLFYNNKIDKNLRRAKFHLLFAVRLIAETNSKPRYLNDKSFDKYCDDIIKKMMDDKTCLDIFKKASDIIYGIAQTKFIPDSLVNKSLTLGIAKSLGKENETSLGSFERERSKIIIRRKTDA